MNTGFEFKVTFNKELDDFEQNKLWSEFVHFVEKNKMSWGGGHSSSYINGYLDCSKSIDNIPELIRKIFDYFINLNLSQRIAIIYPMPEL